MTTRARVGEGLLGIDGAELVNGSPMMLMMRPSVCSPTGT